MRLDREFQRNPGRLGGFHQRHQGLAALFYWLLPYALLGPWGGVVADRYDKRTVLLLGDVARALLMVALAAAVAAQSHILVVMALTAVSSVAGSAERPAAPSRRRLNHGCQPRAAGIGSSA